MKYVLGLFLTPLFYAAFWLALLIFWPVQWLCYHTGGYTAHKRSVDILNGILTYCQVLLLNSTTFRFTRPIVAGQPIIFIANHQSMYDIPALIYFLRGYHAKMVSKIELTRNIPSISYNLNVGGGANIDRNDARQSISQLMGLGKRMHANKWCAIIFPEGTRSRTGQLQQFNHAGIAAILKAVPEAAIVPIAIENSWKIVARGFFPLRTLTALRWTVLQPINTQGLSAQQAVSLAHESIAAHLNASLPTE